MLRRFTLLAVLLFTLSVIAPAVLACESDDACCPDQGIPCEPVVAQGFAEEWACCAEQPIQAVVRVAVRELEARDLQLPNGAPPAAVAQPLRFHATPASSAVPTQRLPDQRQLYLHTGRLRL
jgi:hypothetical protein